MNNTICLRFDSRDHFQSLIGSTPIEPEMEYQGIQLSVLGIIHDVTEVNGEPVFTPLPGWHVNALNTIPDAWQAFVVEPTQPIRRFA